MRTSRTYQNDPHQERFDITAFTDDHDYMSLQTRYVDLHDNQSASRREWFSALPVKSTFYDFNSKPNIILSPCPIDFDVLALSGNDPARIISFMKQYKSMLTNKPKLAICCKSTPKSRASLLLAGIDDVIDINRMHQDEYIARTHAIWARYRHQCVMRHNNLAQTERLARVSNPDRLSPKQRAILLHLLESPDQCASYESLQIQAGSEYQPITKDHLKVIISEIRKKLKSEFTIISDGNSFYRLYCLSKNN